MDHHNADSGPNHNGDRLDQKLGRKENRSMAERAGIPVEVRSRPEAGTHEDERQDDHDVTIYYTGDSAHANALAAQLKTAGRRALVIEIDLCRFGRVFQ